MQNDSEKEKEIFICKEKQTSELAHQKKKQQQEFKRFLKKQAKLTITFTLGDSEELSVVSLDYHTHQDYDLSLHISGEKATVFF